MTDVSHASRASLPPPALILGDDPVNGLGVARNLGRLKVPVHRLGAAREALLTSRYLRTQHVEPGLDTMTDDAYLAVLEAACAKIGDSVVLFPITDLHVLRICRLEQRLGPRFRLTTPSLLCAETLVNKRLFYEAAASFGVDHPATRFPETIEEFTRAAEEIGYPVYLKPEISPLFHKRFHQKGFVATNSEEVVAGATELLGSGLRAVLQEIVPGSAAQMHGCAGYRRDGGASVWVCYRRVREFPVGFGSGSRLETVPGFIQGTRLLEFMDSVSHRGLFDAEFKLDPRRGTFRLIEINTRSWWQNALPTRSGINMVALAYEDAAHPDQRRPLPPQEYTSGIPWIHAYNDFMAAREGGMGLGAWLRTVDPRGEFAFFAADDPLPGAIQLSRIAWGKIRGLMGGKRGKAEPADEPRAAGSPASSASSAAAAHSAAQPSEKTDAKATLG